VCVASTTGEERSSPDRPAAIDHERLSGDVITGAAGKEDNRPCQLMRLAPTPHRRALGDEAMALGVLEERARELGFKVRRSDGVYLHVGLGPFQREHLGQLIDRAFRTGIRGLGGQRYPAYDARYVDNLAAALATMWQPAARTQRKEPVRLVFNTC
jgi:hypothetical protein